MTAQPVATINGSTRDVPVPRPAPFGRRVAVVALTVGATLNLVSSIFTKLGVTDRAAAVARGRDAGLGG